MTDTSRPNLDNARYLVTGAAYGGSGPSVKPLICNGRKVTQETAADLINSDYSVEIYRLVPVRFETQTSTQVHILPDRPRDDVAKAV